MNERMYYRNPYSIYNQHPLFNHQPMNESNDYQPKPFAYQTPYELFAKPAQPTHLLMPATHNNPLNQPSEHPGASGMITDNQGQMDFDKMLSSIGQLASTYHQVSPIVKQLGSLMKLIR